MANML